MPNEPIYSDWDDFWMANRPEVLDLLEQVLPTIATRRLPRVQLTVTADETGSVRPPRTASITIEPNGPGRGHHWVALRLPILLRSRLPAEFIGRVRIDMEAQPGSRASSTWSVDVGTRRRYDDPSIRGLNAYLVQRAREQDANMADMFRSSVGVIQASGLAMQASHPVAGPVPPPQPSPLETITRYAIDRMTEAYERGRTHVAAETPPDPHADAADDEPHADLGQQAPFDAWSAALAMRATQAGAATNVQDGLQTGYGPLDDHGLVESDIIDEPLDVTSSRPSSFQWPPNDRPA